MISIFNSFWNYNFTLAVCDPGCQNGGSCVVGTYGSMCTCVPGFEGKICEKSMYKYF